MTNVVEILKMLNEGENYFIGIKNYSRIGNEVVDEFNMFQRSLTSVPTPFNLSGKEDRLNMSVQNKVYGTVKLNPKQAKKVGLPNEIKTSMMYKSKVIIRDGQLNADNIEVIVDTPTYLKFKKNGVQFTELENATTYPGYHIDIALKGLPISKQVFFTLDDILNNVNKLNELRAKQRVLNSLSKSLLISTPKDEVIPGFTEEQTEVLRDHGLNEKLVYVGVDVKIKDTEETYSGQVINFKVKGSTFSSFTQVLKRVAAGNKLNKYDQVQFDYYNELNSQIATLGMTEDQDIHGYYEAKLKKIKAEIFSLTLENTLIKLSLLESPLNEVAFDTDGEFAYKDQLTIKFNEGSFTK